MVSIQANLNNFWILDLIDEQFSKVANDLDCKLDIDKNGIIKPVLEKCPFCKKKTLLNNGYNSCKDKKAKAFGLDLKKGRIICSNPECKFKLNLPKSVFEHWFSTFAEWIDSIILSLGTKKTSPGDIAQHLREICQMSVSDEYVRLQLKKLLNKIKRPIPQQKPSGVVVHDEQFLKIKGVELKRISTVDANNPNVYYDELHPDRSEETILVVCEELKKLLDNIRAAVMDGNIASKNAFEKTFVGIIIQYCLFHFAKNVRDAYKDEVGYGKGRCSLPIEHLIGYFSILNTFFDHDRELIQLRKLQNEMNENIQRINMGNYPLAKKQEYIQDYKETYTKKAANYLHQIKIARRRKKGIELTLRTEEEAKRLLKEAKQLNVFQKKVQKQIVRLERNWKDFTHCMRDKTIPPTSNKVEQYYALTLNWIEKNNLQSEEQFYQNQMISLVKRYKIQLFKPGIFTDFLKATFALMFTFGVT